MSRELKQARGIGSELSIGVESVFNTPPTAGTLLAHNGSTISATRDVNSSDTIIANRSPAEPFQGNGGVGGGLTLPNDFHQMGLILKAVFGEPDSSAPVDAKAATAVADGAAGTGTVKLTVATGHGIAVGDWFCLYGTTNYNGEWRATEASATNITFKHAYVAETLAAAFVSKAGWTHVFKIKSEQPSFTIEQLHKDLAEVFVYSGCKFSNMVIGAASDGTENVVTLDVLGSKPSTSIEPVAVESFETAASGANTKVTTKTAHGLSTGDGLVIAASKNYNGRHSVLSSADATSFVIAKAYTAESVTAGGEPLACKTAFAKPSGIPIKKINTFAATAYKDDVEYKAASGLTMTFDMGLDGEQRVLGDKGYRSEIPEGKVAVTTEVSILLKNADWFRDGQDNTTIALKLAYAASYGIGGMTINLPENKVNMKSPGIEGPAGIVQQITAVAFSTDTSESASAATITLTSPYKSF